MHDSEKEGHLILCIENFNRLYLKIIESELDYRRLKLMLLTNYSKYYDLMILVKFLDQCEKITFPIQFPSIFIHIL